MYKTHDHHTMEQAKYGFVHAEDVNPKPDIQPHVGFITTK
jgi:hypothetical protein